MLSRAGATSACVILVLQIARQEEVSMHDFEPCQLVPPCGVKDSNTTFLTKLLLFVS